MLLFYTIKKVKIVIKCSIPVLDSPIFIIDFRGPYEPVYEPFYAGFEEAFKQVVLSKID